jgi:tetratricopeptide (TPR) repeat protein
MIREAVSLNYIPDVEWFMRGTDAGFIQENLTMALAFKSLSPTASMAHCRKANERLLHTISRRISGDVQGNQFIPFGKVFSELKKKIPKINQKYFRKVQFGYANPMLHDTSAEMNTEEIEEVIDLVVQNTSSLLGIDINVNRDISIDEAELIIHNLVRGDLESVGFPSENLPRQLSFRDEVIVDDVLHIVDAAEGIGIIFDPDEYLDIGRAAELRGNLFSAERYYREVLKHNQRSGHAVGEIDALAHLASISYSRGDLDEFSHLHEKILSLSEVCGYVTGKIMAHTGLGILFYEKGKLDKAMEKYRISDKLLDGMDDNIGKAILILNMSLILVDSGDLNTGEEKARDALEICKNKGNVFHESKAWSHLGLIRSMLGFHNEAIEINLHNLERKRELKDAIGEAGIMMELGTNYRVQNDLDNARDYYTQSLRLAQKIGHRKGECAALANLGHIHQRNGDYKNAEDYLIDSLKISREVQNAKYTVNCLLDLGSLHRQMENLNKSMRYLAEALEISSDSDLEIQRSQCLNSLGILYRELGDFEKSIDYLLKSIEAGKKSNIARSVARRQRNLAITYQKLGQYDNAISILEESILILQGLGEGAERGEGSHLRTLAVIYADQKNYTMSRNMLMKSLDISVSIGAKQSEALCYHELGVLEWKLDNQEECEENYLRCLKINQEEGLLWGEMDVLRDMARNARGENQLDKSENLLERCNAIRFKMGLKPLES